MTPEDQNNAAAYGLCAVCGAPRTLHLFEETDTNGHRNIWQRILCTRNPIEHYAEDRIPSAPPATTPNVPDLDREPDNAEQLAAPSEG